MIFRMFSIKLCFLRWISKENLTGFMTGKATGMILMVTHKLKMIKGFRENQQNCRDYGSYTKKRKR